MTATRQLTTALIEKIRDAVEPWTKVRRADVQPGEEYLAGSAPRVAGRRTTPSGEHLDWSKLQLCERGTFPRDRVLVRRPLKPALTLADVEPERRFRFVDSPDSGPFRRMRNGWTTPDHLAMVDAHKSTLRRPVELVEDES